MTQPAQPTRTVIVVAVDASPLADSVVDQAAAHARQITGAELHLAHAIDTIPVAAATIGGSPFGVPTAASLMKVAREHLERLLDRAQQQGASNAVGHLLIGSPLHTLLQLTSNLGADLLIAGTHDPGKIERFFIGSVASDLVSKAPCPVLVVRAKREVAKAIPEILPPCPDCLATQQATGGKQLWCARHSEHHPKAHRYYEYPEGFAMGSNTFRPE